MLNILGALLVVAGCGAIGMSAVARLNYRCKLLSAWLFAIDLIQAEINCKLTPLPEIMQQIIQKHSILTGFFDNLNKNWQPWGDKTYSEVWKSSSELLDIPVQERELISEIGSVIGQYNAEQQSRSLSFIHKRIEQSLSCFQKDKQQLSRMYGALGIVSGLAIIIILL